MPTATPDTTPYWSTSTFPLYPKLADDAQADVVVVGGGITGLTAAYLLAKAGKRVVVLERGRCAATDTGHTSAHLTMVTDTRLHELVGTLGRDHAQAVWDAGLAAIERIEFIVGKHQIDCAFERVNGYLHTPGPGLDPEEIRILEKEAATASDLGFDAALVDNVPLVGGAGVRFEHQARFHPRRYLAGVARALIGAGGHIYEHSAAEEFSTDPLSVKVNGHMLSCEDLILATHNPLVGVQNVVGATWSQTKLALYTSYVIAGRVPRGTVPDALFWDTADPYHYLRVETHRDHDYVIFGGEDHKTGQIRETDDCYKRLEAALTSRLRGIEITHRWSGQVIETPDGLPFIGQTADHQYAATGFAGNGMTFGTLAAMVTSDAILGRSNPWSELFDPGRAAIHRGLWDYVKENADYPYYLIRDRFAGAEGRSLRSVKRGEGKVIDRNGTTVAVYRDDRGATTVRSATCTHMGCVVAWNAAERTWDCPCHGSRFKPSGDVISGPAESPLGEVE